MLKEKECNVMDRVRWKSEYLECKIEIKQMTKTLEIRSLSSVNSFRQFTKHVT